MIDTHGWAEFNQHSALCLTSPAACCCLGRHRWVVLRSLAFTSRSRKGQDFSSPLGGTETFCGHCLPSGLKPVRSPKLSLLDPPGWGMGLYTEPLPRCGKWKLATARCHSAAWGPLPTLWPPTELGTPVRIQSPTLTLYTHRDSISPSAQEGAVVLLLGL